MIVLDIIFVVKEKEHERYTREGNNLVYSFDVPLKEVLLNVRFLKLKIIIDNYRQFEIYNQLFQLKRFTSYFRAFKCQFLFSMAKAFTNLKLIVTQKYAKSHYFDI